MTVKANKTAGGSGSWLCDLKGTGEACNASVRHGMANGVGCQSRYC
jgi:hypothetical protein